VDTADVSALAAQVSNGRLSLKLSKPVKVLVFTALFPNNVWPNHGIFVKQRMAKVAQIGGCEVRVIAPVPYHPPIRVGKRWGHSQVAREEVIDGIQVYHPRYFIIPKVSMAFHGFMMFLSVLYLVKRIQAQFDFDIIDAHYVYPDGFAAVLLGALLGKPVVVSARGSDINLFANLPIVRSFVVYTLSRAQRVIAVSEALRQAMVKLGASKDKISVISNGVDTQKFKRVAKVEARSILGLDPSHKIILSVGGLNPVKGFDLLVRSFKLLFDRCRKCKPHLIIAGDGQCRSDLERLIGEYDLTANVCLVGAVPHDRLFQWYSAADVFCLASISEGWPNVLIEALACGVPVVAAAVGGVPEIVTSKAVGLLTERTEQSIAACLEIAMERNWDTQEIRECATAHSWDVAAGKILDVFDSILDPQPSMGRKQLISNAKTQ
jgi:teichuronic acid biosynthesis glycosyltransferase TuaC